MAAIFGLIGPHDPEDVEVMRSRLGHRGEACHIEEVGNLASVGTIGSDPRQMAWRTDSELAVAAGTLYAVDGAREATVSQPNLARLCRRRVADGGIAGLAGIDADFAAVAYQGGSVTLMRDYFGCMPLYWSRLHNGCLAFASEYKAILALRAFAPALDRDMLQYLQATKRLPVGRTLLSNVSAARPGLTVIRNGREIEWQNFPTLVCDVRVHDEETAKRVVSAGFREAMRRRSGSTGPVGLALSGGIDSIGMAFQLRNLFPEREIYTFSAGHGETDPEMATAAEVAAEIGAHHHPVHTPPSLVTTSLPKLVWHIEDPGYRSEALQLMEIGRAASGFVDRLLTGQGADILFAGMPRHRLLARTGRLPAVRGALFEVFDLTQRGIPPQSVIGKALAAGLYRGKVPPVPEIIGGARVERPERVPPGPDFLNRVLAGDCQTSAVQVSAKFERTFGASGVAHASPCFDLAFATMAYTIDERLKIYRGTEKYIFRRALSSVVPAKFRSIPKYPQRMQYDLAFAECLDRMAEDYLSPASVKSRGFFDSSSVARLRRRGAGKPYAAEAAMRLWTAMATEIWARLFLDKDIPDGLSHHGE